MIKLKHLLDARGIAARLDPLFRNPLAGSRYPEVLPRLEGADASIVGHAFDCYLKGTAWRLGDVGSRSIADAFPAVALFMDWELDNEEEPEPIRRNLCAFESYCRGEREFDDIVCASILDLAGVDKLTDRDI